jgi:hypothetical protein
MTNIKMNPVNTIYIESITLSLVDTSSSSSSSLLIHLLFLFGSVSLGHSSTQFLLNKNSYVEFFLQDKQLSIPSFSPSEHVSHFSLHLLQVL